MAFSLLAGNALEVIHFSRLYRLPDKGQMVDDCRFATGLVVFHKQLNVLHVLELDESQLGGSTGFQILRVDLEILYGNVRVGHIEIDRSRLVDEQLDVLGPVRWRRLDLQRV